MRPALNQRNRNLRQSPDARLCLLTDNADGRNLKPLP